MANIPQLSAVLRLNTAVVNMDHISQTPEVSYCYYKLATNVIRACFVIPVVYGLINHGCQPISIQGSTHPVYNSTHRFKEVIL